MCDGRSHSCWLPPSGNRSPTAPPTLSSIQKSAPSTNGFSPNTRCTSAARRSTAPCSTCTRRFMATCCASRISSTPEISTRQNACSEEHTSELQSLRHIVCRLLLEKKKDKKTNNTHTHNKLLSTSAQRRL